MFHVVFFVSCLCVCVGVCVLVIQNNLIHFLFVFVCFLRTNIATVWNNSLKLFAMKVVLLAILLLK